MENDRDFSASSVSTEAPSITRQDNLITIACSLFLTCSYFLLLQSTTALAFLAHPNFLLKISGYLIGLPYGIFYYPFWLLASFGIIEPEVALNLIFSLISIVFSFIFWLIVFYVLTKLSLASNYLSKNTATKHFLSIALLIFIVCPLLVFQLSGRADLDIYDSGDVVFPSIDLPPASTRSDSTSKVPAESNGNTWIAGFATFDKPVNVVKYSATYDSPAGAEGTLSVYWDGGNVGSNIHERVAMKDRQEVSIKLPAEYSRGEWTLAFRLDSYTKVPSSVLINEIALYHRGYDGELTKVKDVDWEFLATKESSPKDTSFGTIKIN